ncbi:MAG: YdcF family protein [Candidatus Omnitrophica bacterium]|nr:YdcF family protein [Candidatus Omnitrophota bacterium]
MASLAEAGNRVLFIENTGVRTPALKDLPRLRKRLLNWSRSVKGFRKERENLFIYSPIILPFPYSRLARWFNRKLLIRALQRWMRACGFRRPILWTFLPTPLVLDLIHELEPELTVYYCIDDFASSSPQARRIRTSEAKLFQKADLVFVTSEKLRQHAQRYTDPVHLFPFGVRFRQFEEARNRSDDLPQDMQNLSRPLIGYVGGLHQWVDQDLLAQAAQRFPSASFVLVGPAQTDVSQLQSIENVHLLGAKSHEELPRYIKNFDVGIVPYRLSEYTAHVYPTKLNEYLAMGIPTVATDLPEIQRFNQEHGQIVSIAGDAEHFSQLIQEAMSHNSSTAVSSRIAVSKRNSWEARIERMSDLIEAVSQSRASESEQWKFALRRLYRVARHQVARTVILLVAAYVLLFRSPFIWWVAEPLQLREKPQRSDAIVVFAGGVGESGQAGGGYQERVKHAVDLFHQGMADRLIFSSGYTFVFREAEMMGSLALSLGVPASKILLETKAANTFQNVTRTAEILRRNGWHSALLVSSPYHMRRALLTWHTQAPEIEVIPTPPEHSQFYVRDSSIRWEQIRGILQEYGSMVYYWYKGWIRFGRD